MRVEPYPGAPLSPRESQVIAMLADGLTHAQVADRLHIGRNTVKHHTSSILARLDAPNMTAAVARWVRQGH